MKLNLSANLELCKKYKGSNRGVEMAPPLQQYMHTFGICCTWREKYKKQNKKIAL